MHHGSRGVYALLIACAVTATACRAEQEQQAASSPLPACLSGTTSLAVDHVIFAVPDLAAAVDSMRARGFTIKPGRLHPDGLLNAHVKFASAQEIELMTVTTVPGSDIAEEYARILAAGGGGAYLALAFEDLESVAGRAEAEGLRPFLPTSGSASFVSFPSDSAAMAVFFGGRGSIIDPDSLLTHENRTSAIDVVWVEGGEALGRLFKALGAAPCGSVQRGGWRGERFGLSNAEVVVVPGQPSTRPRMLGGRLRDDTGEGIWFGVIAEPRFPR